MSLRSAAGAKPSQVICEEVFDEDSIATHDEVLEYARRIGIDPEREPHLLHIADEGVNQSLPPGWKPCFEEEKGLLYYFNFRSGETRWEHPLDNMYRQKVILARKQAASPAGAGASPVTGGAEFGRSRRLCAEEEREKKNVSFAPSVHQIEFDLDEEEEDEEGEDEEQEQEEEAGDHRARHPLQPLQGASWLREKLEDAGRPGTDRLSMLRTAPDRDDSLEMAQDLTEDSQMSLHASEGSDSPRRELERRKEEEVRAALRERRLAEQRRRAQSPSPTPQPPPAAAVVPAPLTPGRLRPLAPVVAPGRGPLAPLPGIGGPPPRPPPGGLAPLAPLGRPALGAVSAPLASLQQKTTTVTSQSTNKPAGKSTPAAAQRAEKPATPVTQQRPPPSATAPAQKSTPVAVSRPEPPSPTAGPRAVKGSEKAVPSSGSQSDRPTPAVRAAAPSPSQRQPEPATAASPAPVSATPAPAATVAAPGQPPVSGVSYQGGRGRAVSFTERLLARKGVTRPGQDADDASPAATSSAGPDVAPIEAKTSTSATTAAAVAPRTVVSSPAPTKPTAATPTTSAKPSAATPTTAAGASPTAAGAVKPTASASSAPAGASLTVDSIPFIDESESSAGSSARAAAAQSRLGAEPGAVGVAGGKADAGMYGGETGTSSSEQSPRQRPETGDGAVAESGRQRVDSADGGGREGKEGQAEREGASVQAATARGVTSTGVLGKPAEVTAAKPRPAEVDKSAAVPQKVEAPSKEDSRPHPESPTASGKPSATAGTVVAQPPVGAGGGESSHPSTVQDSASGVVVGGGADRPALPGSVLSISLRNQNTPETDRERRLRLAAGHSSSGSGSEQDENEIHVGESGELRTGTGRVHSLYPSESDSGSESESESESDDSESSPAEGEEEKEKSRGSPPAKDQKAQPGAQTKVSPAVPSENDSPAKVHVKVASDDTAAPKGRQITRQPTAVDESAASNVTPTRKSAPEPEPVDNIYLRNTLVNDNARPAVVAGRESKLLGSDTGTTEPRETGRKRSDQSRDTRDTIRPQKDVFTPKAEPVETDVPPADERRRKSSGPADASRDQPDARRPSQTSIPRIEVLAPRIPRERSVPGTTGGMAVGPAESDLSSDSDRIPHRPAQRGKVWRNRPQSSASEEAPPSSEDRGSGGQGRWVARTSAAACQTNTEDVDWSPTHGRVRSPTDNRRRRSQTDVALQCGGEGGTEGVRFDGDRRRREPARPAAGTVAVGREDRAVGPCSGLRRLSPEQERGHVSWEHVSVQTPPPPPAPRGSPRQAWTHTTCDHRDCENRSRHGSTARRRPSVLWDTSDADSSDASPRSPPPRPPLPPSSAAHRRHSRGEETHGPPYGPSHGRQRAPVTTSRSCPQCGRGAAARGGRPTATVSSPALGGGVSGGGGGGGGGRQEPTSPARLAVRQMRHRIKALGMWSEGDGASSDGDPAQLSDSAGAADVRRILARAKHFLHGQAGAASRRRRASELASDSEEPSTDEEERSATERDIQLRAVGRHYRRLKQERSHASDSQLNVRPSSAYQPSRGEQLHSSLAAIHTYRPPPPVRRRPPVPTPPAPPPVPRPRAPKPERSVLERTQELKAWLRKATVAWKLGSLDV